MDRLGRRAGSGKALLDHLPLVNSIAVRVHDSLPVQVDPGVPRGIAGLPVGLPAFQGMSLPAWGTLTKVEQA